MAVLWRVERILRDNATFHVWLKEHGTPRSLQAMIIQYFSEAMVVLWLVD
jgi:hypothetical protein